uniref:Uncharacterized protein n=1 Tax=Paramoeba aestuarina TaxID=180227 RepID=A0A7S4KIN7_9EUKA|mmetsp:Transcript_19923/g.31234  ORF Transcript_19923/g.31234 Transcript_19923/m.31234 type:complete len:337 (+) Transcript_19923:90-1100(+)
MESTFSERFNYDLYSEGFDGRLGPCSTLSCFLLQLILIGFLIFLLLANYFGLFVWAGKIRFLTLWFFGHFLNCASVSFIAYGEMEMKQIPWPSFLWFCVSFIVSFVHLASSPRPRKENYLFVLSFLPAGLSFIFMLVIDAGELFCPYLVHWILIPTCGLVHCYFLRVLEENRSGGGEKDQEDDDDEGVREVSHGVSPLDAYVGWGLLWAMVGPWLSLFAYSHLPSSDQSAVFQVIVIWLSFSLFFCLAIPLFVHRTFPLYWALMSLVCFAQTIAGIFFFSIVFFVRPDIPMIVVCLLLFALCWPALWEWKEWEERRRQRKEEGDEEKREEEEPPKE